MRGSVLANEDPGLSFIDVIKNCPSTNDTIINIDMKCILPRLYFIQLVYVRRKEININGVKYEKRKATTTEGTAPGQKKSLVQYNNSIKNANKLI